MELSIVILAQHRVLGRAKAVVLVEHGHSLNAPCNGHTELRGS